MGELKRGDDWRSEARLRHRRNHDDDGTRAARMMAIDSTPAVLAAPAPASPKPAKPTPAIPATDQAVRDDAR